MFVGFVCHEGCLPGSVNVVEVKADPNSKVNKMFGKTASVDS